MHIQEKIHVLVRKCKRWSWKGFSEEKGTKMKRMKTVHKTAKAEANACLDSHTEEG